MYEMKMGVTESGKTYVAGTEIGAEVPTVGDSDASALSGSEMQLASAMVSVSSPLPFLLQPEPR